MASPKIRHSLVGGGFGIIDTILQKGTGKSKIRIMIRFHVFVARLETTESWCVAFQKLFSQLPR